jgi:Fibronectin type III domain
MATAFAEGRRNVILPDIRPAFNKTQEVCLFFILFLVVTLFIYPIGARAELVPPQNLRIVDGVGGGSELSLAWDAVLSGDLAGYNVYWGIQSHTYDNMIPLGIDTTYTLTGLPPVTIYSAVTASDVNGIQSDFSNEVNNAPIPPSGVLLGTGILGLGLLGRRRKRS